MANYKLLPGSVLIFFSLSVLLSCVTTKKVVMDRSPINSPNGVKIDENRFLDRSEIKQIDWREYLYWVGRIYGKESKEYLDALPRSGVWTKADSTLKQAGFNYEKNAVGSYNNYPVVGISREQGIAFSEWRSDRVFEMQLIKAGIIKPNPNQTAEDHFTTERFLSGELKVKLHPQSKIYYPVYRLPTADEYRKIIHEDLSKYQQWAENSKLGCPTEAPHFVCSNNTDLGELPIKKQYFNPLCADKLTFKHILGNVAEWTMEPGKAAGGSWKNSRQEILDSWVKPETKRHNAWTGFRNICIYKLWEGRTE